MQPNTNMDRLMIYIKAYINGSDLFGNERGAAVGMMLYVINRDQPTKDDVVNALKAAGILEEVREFIISHRWDMPAQLSGGNRHTKRTKRTTHRKMRKSLIRRRR
jgi:hypothetical protein